MTGDPAHQQAADRRSAAPMPGRSNQKRQPLLVLSEAGRFSTDMPESWQCLIKMANIDGR